MMALNQRGMMPQTTASGVMRFSIRRSLWWRPLLVLFGGTAGRSYLELTGDALVARFGWLFHHRFPLGDIEGAAKRSWPLLYGIGWRTNLLGVIGLIGSRAGVVEIRFRRRRWLWMLLPLPFDRLAVSLKDPEAFLEALEKAA
jgi:hypothetical protein